MGRWGYFITFEGLEGSGKSTLADGLYKYLKKEGYSVVFTREPGGTKIGEAIRPVLLQERLSVWTEVFLFLAARRENVEKVIYPALQWGKVVISDRFSDSTLAYQGFGRDLPLKILSRFNKFATRNLSPQLTFLVDIPPQVGLKRISNRKFDRFEGETQEFHQKVREGFLRLAHRAKKRVYILNGTLKEAELLEEIKQVTLKRLPLKRIIKK